MPKVVEVFIHNKLYKYIYWDFGSQSPGAFGQTKRHNRPQEEFVQFQEVLGSIDRIKYLTYHSCESRFHCAFSHHENTYFHLSAALR